MSRIAWNEVLKRCKSDASKTDIQKNTQRKKEKQSSKKKKKKSSLITVLKSMAK